MNDIFERVEGLARGFQDRLSVQTAYGEPVTSNGVTVVPVAKVRFGFGGGGGGGTGSKPATIGEGPMGAGEESGSGGGGGGGGGGGVEPIGFIEITSAGARWVPVEPSRAELALRALMTMAVIAPGGGRRGFFRRLGLMLVGQGVVAALTRPRLPPLEGVFSRPAAEVV
jgi:uncharacterized spore protein YtfJ